ncbi:MAG: hypothetical protein ACOX47_13200 [Bacillota bacterium]|jgi:hypothetical protein
MDISLFKKSNIKKETIDIETAFNIWNMLRTRYESLEVIMVVKNFAHDRDFILFLDHLTESFQKRINVLEKESEKFRIKLSDRPASTFKIVTQIDELTDKYVYHRIYADLIANLFSLSRTIRTSTTNDRVRLIFQKLLIDHVASFEQLFSIGRLKGWEAVAPAYKTGANTQIEQITVSEAFHIWDHIGQRYDQLQLTQFFLNFVHDPEFTIILKTGISTLTTQIKLLEKLAYDFDVTLPERPPLSMTAHIDPESLEDKFIYATILRGIQDSTDLHIRAVIECL